MIDISAFVAMIKVMDIGSIILWCMGTFAIGFTIGILVMFLIPTLRRSSHKKQKSGFDEPAQLISRRDVELSEYLENSRKETVDGANALNEFKKG